jgi:hypothetical protein
MDHLHLALGESRKLVFPLVLERGWAHHQHALDAKVARKQLGRRNRLHRFAQPISSPIRQRPARAANRAPSRW